MTPRQEAKRIKAMSPHTYYGPWVELLCNHTIYVRDWEKAQALTSAIQRHRRSENCGDPNGR